MPCRNWSPQPLIALRFLSSILRVWQFLLLLVALLRMWWTVLTVKHDFIYCDYLSINTCLLLCKKLWDGSHFPMINIKFMPYHHLHAFLHAYHRVVVLETLSLAMKLDPWSLNNAYDSREVYEHFWAASQHGLAHSIYKIYSNFKDILNTKKCVP